MKSHEMHGSFDLIRSSESKKYRKYFGGPLNGDTLSHSGSENTQTIIDYDNFKNISKYLRHIPVNPHNLEVSSIILKSYVLIKQACDGNKSNIVNENPYNVLKFMANLVKSSKKERSLSFDTGANNPTINTLAEQCVYVLHGERGTGKTFFLNYILTKCDLFLDKREVIWARVNLVYRNVAYERDIIAWMHAQATKIALRYYDVNSQFSKKKKFDLTSHLYGWVETNRDLLPHERDGMRSKIRSMRRVFCEQGADEPISPNICNPELCREAYRYLRSIGWSFIFVLDGFDRLDVLPEQTARFLTLKAEIEKILSMRTAFGATILVVSRTYTLDEVISVDPFRGISHDNKYVVSGVDFAQILRSRLEAIKHVVIDSVPSYRRGYNKELEQVVNKFIAEVASDAGILKEVNENFSYNIRAKMQFVYLLFLNYINKLTGKEYIVVEHIMKNGHKYAAVAYKYAAESGRLVIAKSEELNNESRFLPIITRYPAVTNASGECKVRSSDQGANLLAGIRVLQAVEAATALDQSGAQEKMTVGELAGLLTKAFGYDEQLTFAFANELDSFEMLRILRDSRVDFDSPVHRITILPKGQYFLRRFTGDVAYLNMCAMRTFFSDSVFEGGYVTKSYLGDGGAQLGDWVRTKIRNAVFLFGVMVKVDVYQKKGFQASRGQYTERQENVLDGMISAGLWRYFEERKQHLITDVEYITDRSKNLWASMEVVESWDVEIRRALRELRV